MREWLNGLEVYPFRLDEWEEDMYLDTKVTGTPELKFIPFDENGETIYKGEGSIQFTSYNIWKYKEFNNKGQFLPNDGKGQESENNRYYDTNYKLSNSNGISYKIQIKFTVLSDLLKRQLILGNYKNSSNALNIELQNGMLRVYPFGANTEVFPINVQQDLIVNITRNNNIRECNIILNGNELFFEPDAEYNNGNQTLRLFNDHRATNSFTVINGLQIEEIAVYKNGILDYLLTSWCGLYNNTIAFPFNTKFKKSNIENSYVKVQVDESILYIDSTHPSWDSSDIATWDSKTGIVKIGDKIIPPKDIKTGAQYILGNPIATIRPRQERDSDIIELSPNIISISGKSLYY